MQLTKSKTKSINQFTLQEKQSILKDYFFGLTEEQLLKKHSITKTVLNNILQNKDKINFSTEPLQKQIELFTARENQIIMNLKEKVYDFYIKAIDEGMDQENKIYYLSKVKDMEQAIDKNKRLNQGESTENIKTENKNYNIDVAELLKKYPTTEDKRDYLLSKMQNVEDNANNS